MSQTRLVLFFVGTIASSSAALAAEWDEIAKSDSAMTSVDASSIRQAGAYTHFWMKRELFKPEADATKVLLFETRMDCKKRRMAIIAGVAYDQDGKSLRNYTFPESLIQFVAIPPESGGEAVFNRICHSPR